MGETRTQRSTGKNILFMILIIATVEQKASCKVWVSRKQSTKNEISTRTLPREKYQSITHSWQIHPTRMITKKSVSSFVWTNFEKTAPASFCSFPITWPPATIIEESWERTFGMSPIWLLQRNTRIVIQRGRVTKSHLLRPSGSAVLVETESKQ